MSLVSLALGCFAIGLAYRLFMLRRSRNGLSKIPGPKGMPLIGHTTMLEQEPQKQFRNWAAEYGPLFKLRIGWEDWVFVTEPKAIKEIFDKQSKSTSGRQPMPVLSDLLSGGKRFLLQTYTPEWRKLRAIVHRLLTPKSSELFKPSQEFEAKQLLFDIHDSATKGDDGGFYMHVRRYTTSVIMTSTYGRRIPQWVCTLLHEAMHYGRC